MCWGISNRVKKSWEKNENVAHQNEFQVTTMPPCKNVSTSSKTQFCSNRGKKQHFLVENTFFCWKTEERLKIKQLCWMINLVMLNILQAFLIQKLLFPWNHSVLKSADQFEEILNYFKKFIKAFFGVLMIINNRKTFKKLLCHHLTFRLRWILPMKNRFPQLTMSKMVQTCPNRSQTSKFIITNIFRTSISDIRITLKKISYPWPWKSYHF